jgi:glycosyltransferase involved in cell wall biosynthesis
MKTMNNENNLTEVPLVSIIVITYNSSKYVLETLESAKAQTYSNIELIISDDCSTDDTFYVCEKWIENNSKFFVSSKLVSGTINKGVAGNCNRGLSLAKGKWIKLIAGDDLLIENCIGTNINYIKKNRESKLIFSQSIIFDSSTGIQNGVKPPNDFKLPNGNRNQLLSLLKKDFVNASSVFFKKELIENNSGFDERYPFMEDYPMWFKLLNEGNCFYYMPVPTVLYRISGASLSNTNGGINLKWFNSSYNFFNENIRPELVNKKMYYSLYYKKLDFFLKLKRLNTKNRFLLFFYRGVGSVIFRIFKI